MIGLGGHRGRVWHGTLSSPTVFPVRTTRPRLPGGQWGRCQARTLRLLWTAHSSYGRSYCRDGAAHALLTCSTNDEEARNSGCMTKRCCPFRLMTRCQGGCRSTVFRRCRPSCGAMCTVRCQNATLNLSTRVLDFVRLGDPQCPSTYSCQRNVDNLHPAPALRWKPPPYLPKRDGTRVLHLSHMSTTA